MATYPSMVPTITRSSYATPKLVITVPMAIIRNNKTDLYASKDGSQLGKDGSGKRKGRSLRFPRLLLACKKPSPTRRERFFRFYSFTFLPFKFPFLLLSLFIFLTKKAPNSRQRVAARLPDKNILIVSILHLRPIMTLAAEGIFIKLYTSVAKAGGIAGGKMGVTGAKLATNEPLITIFSPQKRKKGKISFRITQKTIIFALSKTITE